MRSGTIASSRTRTTLSCQRALSRGVRSTRIQALIIHPMHADRSRLRQLRRHRWMYQPHNHRRPMRPDRLIGNRGKHGSLLRQGIHGRAHTIGRDNEASQSLVPAMSHHRQLVQGGRTAATLHNRDLQRQMPDERPNPTIGSVGTSPARFHRRSKARLRSQLLRLQATRQRATTPLPPRPRSPTTLRRPPTCHWRKSKPPQWYPRAWHRMKGSVERPSRCRMERCWSWQSSRAHWLFISCQH